MEVLKSEVELMRKQAVLQAYQKRKTELAEITLNSRVAVKAVTPH